MEGYARALFEFSEGDKTEYALTSTQLTEREGLSPSIQISIKSPIFKTGDLPLAHSSLKCITL